MSIASRTSRFVASIAAVAALAAVSTVPAMAETGLEPVNDSRARLVQYLDESGVPDGKQQALADKVVSGQSLESDSSSSIPTSESTRLEDGFIVVRKDYADGSFIESAVEIAEPASAPGTVAPLGISGCSSTVGSGYVKKSNCLVYVNAASFSANFRATYVHGGGALGEISSVWDSSVQVYGGTFSNKSLSITRRASSGSIPAEARLKWKYTAWGGVASGDSAIYLRVTGRNAWTANN